MSIRCVYEQGYLTKQELWNIAYYVNNQVNKSDIEFDIIPKNHKTLEEETEQMLKEHVGQFSIDFFNEHKYYPLEGYNITGYYGTYGRYIAVQIHKSGLTVDLFEPTYEGDEIIFNML